MLPLESPESTSPSGVKHTDVTNFGTSPWIYTYTVEFLNIVWVVLMTPPTDGIV